MAQLYFRLPAAVGCSSCIWFQFSFPTLSEPWHPSRGTRPTHMESPQKSGSPPHRSLMKVALSRREVSKRCPIEHHSPASLAPGTSFMEDNFSTDQGEGWLWDGSNALHLLCTLFLLVWHYLHLRSPGIRSRRLGAPALLDCEDFLGRSNNLDVFFALFWVSTWETEKREGGCCEGCGCEKDGEVKIRVSATLRFATSQKNIS